MECNAVPRLGDRADYREYTKTRASERVAQSQKSIAFGHGDQIGLPIVLIENIIKI